jgi:hypothetical protein
VAFVGSGLFLWSLATHTANKAESEAAEDDETHNNEAKDDKGALEH